MDHPHAHRSGVRRVNRLGYSVGRGAHAATIAHPSTDSELRGIMLKPKPIDPEPIERVGIFPPRVWYTAPDTQPYADAHDNCHTDFTGTHCDCHATTAYHAELAAFLDAHAAADSNCEGHAYLHAYVDTDL